MVADERLSPVRRLAIGGFTVIMAAVGFAGGRAAFRPGETVTQPIQFNHQKHVTEVGLDCPTCHEYYTTSAHSGLPTLATCQGCHATPLTDSPEEARLVALAERDPQPQFQKLFRMPNHVYYSHRRHVVAANLPCETCHGGVAATTAPPPRPLVRVTMDSCMDCHAERNVTNDCTGCHR